jgi:hypothetical protein
MPAVLEVPSVAPDYRRGRSHADFLANLDVPAELIKDRLRSEWDAFQTGRREELDGGRPVDIG